MRASVAAHVVVDDLADLALSREDAHHLGSVLRLRAGEPVGATDGRGGYVACVWSGSGALQAVAEMVSEPRRPEPVTVGFVPVKGDRPDWVVQKLTELGVDEIVVLRSERSVVRWDGERADTQMAKLERVARAAVMQSRQVWMPAVVGVRSLADFAAGPSVARADLDGEPLDAATTTVLVGPEGGWSDDERRRHRRSVGLGPTVLRAETAAVAAGVLLTAVRDGRIRPGGRL